MFCMFSVHPIQYVFTNTQHFNFTFKILDKPYSCKLASLWWFPFYLRLLWLCTCSTWFKFRLYDFINCPYHCVGTEQIQKQEVLFYSNFHSLWKSGSILFELFISDFISLPRKLILIIRKIVWWHILNIYFIHQLNGHCN